MYAKVHLVNNYETEYVSSSGFDFSCEEIKPYKVISRP